MAWEPNSKEIQNVFLLTAAARYSYFVKKVADQERLWSLRKQQAKGGWVLFGDNHGREIVPVWPHKNYATACAKIEFSPEPIGLSTWLDKWLPGIKSDNRLIAVFPNLTEQGVVVTAERLGEDLRAEIANYE